MIGRKKGTALVSPMIYLFLTFCILLAVLIIYKINVTQIYSRLDDAVTSSYQSVCIADRYVSAAYHWNRENVVFHTGSRAESDYYFTEPEVATSYAAEEIYRSLEELLEYNLPPETTGHEIKELCLVNIINGTAYEYNLKSGQSCQCTTSEEESYLKIKVEVSLELPLFGATSWSKEDKVILLED